MNLTRWQQFKATFFLRVYTFLKIPLIWWVRPIVLETGKRSIIKIRLGRRTKNHLNSMYFGALAIGGELVVALKSVQTMQEKNVRVDFVFKDFSAEFFKRADGDVHFICDEGDKVDALLARALASTERVEDSFESYAVVESSDPQIPVAKFRLTLSMRHRK
jgi:hypothetical protein